MTRKWKVAMTAVALSVAALTAVACGSQADVAPAASGGTSPDAPLLPVPIADSADSREPPITSQPPVSILDSINPDECSFVHNINACFVDGQPPADVPLGDLSNAYFVAREDLLSRFELSAGTVRIKSAEAVEWGDTSLGNPQPGMVYAQVVTPGLILVLQDGTSGSTYTYHTGGGRSTLVETQLGQ